MLHGSLDTILQNCLIIIIIFENIFYREMRIGGMVSQSWGGVLLNIQVLDVPIAEALAQWYNDSLIYLLSYWVSGNWC